MGKARAASRSGTLSAACAALIVGSPAVAQDQGQAATDTPLATFDEHGLNLRTADDSVNFHLGGRLHMDFADGDSSAVTDPVPDTFDIRRLWIEPKLTINKDLIFGLQYDFSKTGNDAPINNLIMSYKGFGPFTLTGGNFKEPFSFDALTSNNNTLFMERSLASAFTPSAGHMTGFAVGTHGENWTLASGVFGGNINVSVPKGGTAGIIRATYAPILTSDEVLHFGASGSYRWLDRQGPRVSFDTTPESHLFSTSLVDTGTIDGADAIGRLGFELAWANGPFRMQAEYIANRVERAAEQDVTFHGGYVQGAWVINGKSPRYTLDADTPTEVAVFSRVTPETGQRVSHGGVGVIEAAARYSVIDLTDGDIRGGFQQDVTVGLNWYPEPYARVMANYIHAWADPTADSVTGSDTQADIFQARIQIAF
jgi:phosphate-selective porin OprO/OprP